MLCSPENCILYSVSVFKRDNKSKSQQVNELGMSTSRQVNKSTGLQVNKTRATGMAKAKDRGNPHALRGARFKPNRSLVFYVRKPESRPNDGFGF